MTYTHYPILSSNNWIQAGLSSPYENFTLPYLRDDGETKVAFKSN